MSAAPTAQQAKAAGFVDVGAYRIEYVLPPKRWMDTWHVYGPQGIEGKRTALDSFARYPDAVRFARNRAEVRFTCPACKGGGVVALDNPMLAAFRALTYAAREFDSDPDGLNRLADFWEALTEAERVLGIPTRAK